VGKQQPFDVGRDADIVAAVEDGPGLIAHYSM
jgi:hypothetical protein